jgi:hypothetical protein
MYASKDFKTKKAFKEAIAAGKKITVYEPNSDLTGAVVPQNGKVAIEGPHFPASHTWWATATLKSGYVIKVI